MFHHCFGYSESIYIASEDVDMVNHVVRRSRPSKAERVGSEIAVCVDTLKDRHTHSCDSGEPTDLHFLFSIQGTRKLTDSSIVMSYSVLFQQSWPRWLGAPPLCDGRGHKEPVGLQAVFHRFARP